MTVLAFASCKASPGVTTAVVALAAAWPRDRSVLIVEADPDGGALAPRFGLATDPGLVSASAAAFRGGRGRDLLAHAQQFGDGLRVLAGPASAEHALGALEFADSLAAALLDLGDVDVLLDLGRLGPRSPSWPLADAAAAVVFLCRPRLDEVHHLVHAGPATLASAATAVLVTVGGRPYPPSEVAAAVALPLAGTLPVDSQAAQALSEGLGSHRALRHSALMRAATDLVPALIDMASRQEAAVSEGPG